jgi:hypothetical protein
MGLLLVAAVQACASSSGPPEAHRILSEAGLYAVSTGNAELLSALLKAGLQVNEVLQNEPIGQTLLSHAAGIGDARMVRFLLKHGASRHVRDGNHAYPVSCALATGQLEICEMLKLPDLPDQIADGVPIGLFDELLVRGPSTTNVVFVMVNGGDPSSNVLAVLRGRWPRAVPISSGEVLPGSQGPVSRARETKELGIFVGIKVGRREGQTYWWTIDVAEGPGEFYRQQGVGGKRYGTWLLHLTLPDREQSNVADKAGDVAGD